jgi:hypothetical protein
MVLDHVADHAPRRAVAGVAVGHELDASVKVELARLRPIELGHDRVIVQACTRGRTRESAAIRSRSE